MSSTSNGSRRRRKKRSLFKRVIRSREFLWIVLAVILAFSVAHFIINRPVSDGSQVAVGGG